MSDDFDIPDPLDIYDTASHIAKTYEHAWNGDASIRDLGQLELDTAKQIPEYGEAVPDVDVQSDDSGGGGGNFGNKAGTVIGGIMGAPFGGLGAPGAAIGSKLGGWIEDGIDDISGGDVPLVPASLRKGS